MQEPAEFERDAAARVLRRAIELAERDQLDSSPDMVSEAALIDAADELGVDVAAVRRAAAEERVGALSGRGGRLDRLAGPATVSATRIVDLPAAELMSLVDQWLRRGGTLRRRRLDDGALVAEYSRRSDPMAGFQRSLRAVRGQEHLGRIRRLRVVVHSVDERRSVVALVADLEVERTAAVAGGASVAGVGSTVSIVEVFAASPWLWLGVPASLAAGAGVLRWRARGVPDVELALQGVLDRVVALDLPSSVLSDVRDRLLSGRPRSRRAV